jgi:hypothetical protein
VNNKIYLIGGIRAVRERPRAAASAAETRCSIPSPTRGAAADSEPDADRLAIMRLSAW